MYDMKKIFVFGLLALFLVGILGAVESDSSTTTEVCAGEGENVYDMSEKGPTSCCGGLILDKCVGECAPSILGTCVKCRDENAACTPEDIPCCEGLIKVPMAFEDEDGRCVAATCGSICRPCGNGICDDNENRCNCPEDCQEKWNIGHPCFKNSQCKSNFCLFNPPEIETGVCTELEIDSQIKETESESGNQNQGELTQSQIKNIIQTRNRLRIQAQTGECPENCTCTGSTTKCQLNEGKEIVIQAGKSGNTIVQVKGVDMSTKVTLYKADETIYGVFKNNETKAVRILPDEIKDKIKQRTRARLENQTIELDEEGIYQVRAQKRARLFFLIPVREKVRAQINSETGEIIRVRNSWWGFLASDVEEEEPYCDAIGTKSEGWYQYDELIKYDTCEGCYAVCSAIGTKSEGWYSSCTNELIKWEVCEDITTGI